MRASLKSACTLVWICLLLVAVSSVGIASDFFGRVSGNVEGLVLTGNVERVLFTSRNNYVYKDSAFDFDAFMQFSYGEQFGVKAEHDFTMGASVNYLSGTSSSPFAYGSFEYNRLRLINERYQGGLGYEQYIYRDSLTQLKVSGALIADVTDFVDRQQRSYRYSLRFKNRHLFHGGITIKHETYYQPSVSSGSDFRLRTLVNASVPLAAGMGLSVAVQNIYESFVIQGRKRNDLRLTLGVSYGFAM